MRVRDQINGCSQTKSIYSLKNLMVGRTANDENAQKTNRKGWNKENRCKLKYTMDTIAHNNK